MQHFQLSKVGLLSLLLEVKINISGILDSLVRISKLVFEVLELKLSTTQLNH